MFLSKAEREIKDGNYVETSDRECAVWHSVRKDFEELRGETQKKNGPADDDFTSQNEDLLDSISGEIIESDSEDHENMEENELLEELEDNMEADDDNVEVNREDQAEQEEDMEIDDEDSSDED